MEKTKKVLSEESCILETSPETQNFSEVRSGNTSIETNNAVYHTTNNSTTKQLETAQRAISNSLNELNKTISSSNILKVTSSLVTDAPPLPKQKSGDSYIEDGQMIIRTDGKEITDEDIPYLIQLGQDKAIAKWKIPDLTRIITESYQIMCTTDNPETLCSRYKVIIKKVNELATLEQQGLFDTNTFNYYNTLISDDNYYNLILTCYQKYAAKARSELKTQNGISNRINKFWKIICNNVSPEFYNSKLQK